ncbi:glycosyltransferase family 61 protein [Pseudomonas sp. NBRC 100443]|uniref:glycosyltransferase 61 family protein n=1 Tax=Pseudomonas TaxID=286 RepID=UPI0024A4A71F|nr:glycosyltransferase family 61 protein [Pseudomonas sp. NBRC 100443]GLU36624.1 hypothetical protein Pssp01_07170 [Pseudomonas sp. NBRC 100443]
MQSDTSQAGAAVRFAGKNWSLAAYWHIARRRLARKQSENLKSVAAKSWDIAPRETTPAPPAFFLPNQWERVTGWEEKLFFPYEHPRRTMEGLGSMEQHPTRGYLIKDVLMIDGTLYKDGASFWLSSTRPRWLPRISVEREVDRGAVYCSPYGNRWFGTWLAEDCLTYALARDEGLPVTIAPSARYPLYPQMLDYEAWLDMQPTRLHSAFFRELVLFDDFGHNSHQHLRYRAMGEKLLAHVNYQAHPGVFILRGETGDLRLLVNEMEIAEHLRKHRGFRILDPTKSDLPTIVATCAGARVVVGVEGSQLVHGVNVLPPGSAVLALQPPNRFVCFYKYLTDRDHQHFGFVVGTPEGEGFRIDLEEVERTLDLFPA